MRNTIIIFIISLLAVSCGKDKYTSAPQIKFKSLSPNTATLGIRNDDPNLPYITINITDKEGDLGFKSGKDTAFIFIKSNVNNGIATLDSFVMPDINAIANKNFQADIRVNTVESRILRSDPTRAGKRTDTIHYEIYVKDFAKNKSNVVTNGDPIFYKTP